MRVFVTGASGWIGRAVVPELTAAGRELAGALRLLAGIILLRVALLAGLLAALVRLLSVLRLPLLPLLTLLTLARELLHLFLQLFGFAAEQFLLTALVERLLLIVALLVRQFLLTPGQLVQTVQSVVDILLLLLGRNRHQPQDA